MAFISIANKRPLYFLTGLFLLISSCNTTKLDVEEIKFRADACFGTCPIFEMTIGSNGATSFNALQFNKLKGQFKTVLNRSKIDSITMLLQKAGFFRLDDKYTTEITDQPTYTLTVKLKGQQPKTVVDYGPSGPEKLKDVYKLLFSLRDSQNWK